MGAESVVLNGGTLAVSTGSSSLSGTVSLGAASSLSVSGTALSVSGVVNDNGHGFSLSGPGTLTLSNASNTISTVSSSSILGALDMKNSTSLAVGSLSATGDVTIANTGNLTIMSGQGISSTGGNIVLAGSKFFNLAGVNAFTLGSTGAWKVWSANAAPLETLANGGDDTGNLVNDFVQYGATYGTSQVLGTGHGLLYSFAPTLTGRLQGTIQKTYDGTATASVGGSNLVVDGLLNGDVLSLSQAPNAVFTTAGTGASITEVGTGKNVNVNASILTATNGSKTIYGYVLTTPVMSGPGEIVKAPITLNMSKTYDGLVGFNTLNTYTVGGTFNGDLVTLSAGSAEVLSPNAGSYSVLANNTFSITSDRYTLTDATYAITILKAPLTVAVTATYSGSTALVPTAQSVQGLQNGETMVVTGITAQSANHARNGTNFVTALTGKTVGSTADLNNYSVNLNSSPVTINRKKITLSGTLTASKTYDGNLSASVLTTGVTPSLVLGNDNLSIALVSGLYDSVNVSNSRVVSINSVTLGGTSADNYEWDTASGQTAAGTILQLPSATWVGANGANWSDGSNWGVTGNLTQTGVLPNLSNVALAIIPSGSTTVANVATGYTGKIELAGTLKVADDSYLGAVPATTTADLITIDGGTFYSPTTVPSFKWMPPRV
jgi:hypothetical protein